MASRLKLHEELCELLGNENVYYNPPESLKMSYPCIRYNLSGMDHKHANDRIYNSTNRYELIVIDHDPDSDIPNRILSHFQMCRFDRKYVSNNLNHFAITIYY